MRRYEFVEGKSAKFWEIELEGESFVTRWGRIGTEGQEKTQDFDSAAEARKAHDKLVTEKEKKGYKLVGGDANEVAAGPLTSKGISHPEFEKAIADNPDDLSHWRVYADWLIENGESWGEVIAQACAGKPNGDKQRALAAAIFGDVDGAKVTWKHGVMDEIALQPEEFNEEMPPATALERALKHPAGRLVRKLTLGLPPDEDGDISWHMETWGEALGKAGVLPLLTDIDMSEPAEHMDQRSWRRIGDVRQIWKAAPGLKSLRFEGAQGSDDGTPLKLSPIDAPQLETLVFQSGGLSDEAPKAVGKGKLPKLKHVEFWLGREDYGNTCSVDSFADVFEGKNLPALEYLGVMNSEWGNDLVDALALAPIVKRLKVLDLSMGTMFHDAAQRLVMRADAFKHLQQLVLDDNYFTEEDVKAIKAALPNASVEAQKELDDPDEPEWRYTTAGE